MSDNIDTSAIEARYLPGILQEIAGLIGLPKTLDLVRHYGGSRLYIPKRFDPNLPVAKIVGHASYAALQEAFGGLAHFDIPKGEIAIKAVRDKQIRAERSAGATYSRLAIKWQLTERQLRNICGPDEDDKQVSLF
jgi:hypothetical protein